MNRFSCRIPFLLLAAVLLWPVTGNTARVNDLFQAEVSVASRSAGARDDALRRALRQVLLRVTGSPEPLSGEAARSLLKKPGRFVEQFRYRDAPAPGKAPRLWVRFDGVALEREVRRTGLPFWGQERPDILVWLAVDDRGRRYLVPENSPGPEAKAVRMTARARGLPVTLPLMDLLDQSNIRFADVWGGFETTILQASERYRPQVVLTGRLERSPGTGEWRGEWKLLKAGVDQQWTSHAQDLAALSAAGVATAGERLAARYALHAAGASTRTLLVEGVEDLDAYARVQAYLASLSPVDELQVVQVADGSVEFALQLNASERSLLQLITLGRELEPVDDPSLWHFRYRP